MSPQSQRSEVKDCLLALEAELKRLQLWQTVKPSDEALASSQPFAVDTMAFDQWLQWIFIAKMHFLLDQQLALPQACGIQPMVDEWARESGKPVANLNHIMLTLDYLLSSVSA